MYEAPDRTLFIESRDECRSAHVEVGTPVRMALIGGYLPRRCGIATFTADTYASLKASAPNLAIDVYAMAPAQEAVAFDPAVRAAITEGDAASFTETAQRIETSGADIVWLQHEFGLFGGRAGDAIFDLIDRVSAPLIVTLHTVLADPDIDQRRVMERLIARASQLIVMSERSRHLLLSVYHADADQVAVIPHGVPDRPFGRSRQFKARFALEGRRVVLTFGLLSPGKGIEAVIEALPAIVALHPDVLYCIAGATHPNLLAREGEAYRDRLKALAAAHGVEANIRWIDAFLETDELLDLIEAADIYVTPYTGAQQSTSGTLSYAMALGKAVVSTPYEHAVELLGDDHGVLVPFDDSAAIAKAIAGLLDDPDRLQALQRRAYDRARSMIWPNFAARSHKLIDRNRMRPVAAALPDRVGIAGFLRLCDDTGMLQHGVHGVPDRAHGYCIDDNARALMLMNRLPDAVLGQCGRLPEIFAAFVQHAWNPDAGAFRNFMDFARHWLEDAGSEDSNGRTLWALGATAREGRTPGLRRWARQLLDRALPSALRFRSPRATAFSMLGSDYLLDTGDEPLARQILAEGAERLLALRVAAARPGWQWYESVLAYDNARLPEAMLRAGIRMDRPDMIECGLETLRWLSDVQTAPRGHFRPVGSDSFGRAYAPPRPFDQQPVEIWATIDAAAAAYDITGDVAWLRHAREAYDWFAGCNDRGVAIGEPASGTSRDGLTPRGPNLNEGAESVLAYQHADRALRDFIAKAG